MNFTKFDMVLLIVMSIGIVVMSFVFPALGLTSVETGESDIPEFSMDGDRFDFAADFPSNPGTPSTATMQFDTSRQASLSDNTRWLNGNTTAGVQMTLVENASAEAAEVNLLGWDGGNVTNETNVTLTDVGDAALLELDYQEFEGYDVYVELTEDRDVSGGTVYEIEYEIRDQPSFVDNESGWLERIPLIGDIFGAGQAVASILGWGFSVIWWFVTSAWQLVLNLIGMLFDVATFLFASASWLATTYGGIIEAADSWVAVFVAIPGLLLSLEFAKLGMIAISLLPFT